jgi:hypothetical protein
VVNIGDLVVACINYRIFTVQRVVWYPHKNFSRQFCLFGLTGNSLQKRDRRDALRFISEFIGFSYFIISFSCPLGLITCCIIPRPSVHRIHYRTCIIIIVIISLCDMQIPSWNVIQCVIYFSRLINQAAIRQLIKKLG